MGLFCLTFLLHQPIYAPAHLPLTFAQMNQIASLNTKRLYESRCRIDPSFKKNPELPLSKLKIDIAIPLVEKDLETAALCVESIRAFIMHPIGEIFIIAPVSKKIQAFAKKHGCTYVEESSLFPDFAKIKALGGWMLQQFIKLNVDKLGTSPHCLVVDADMIFLRPQLLHHRNKYLVPAHFDACLGRKRMARDLLQVDKMYLIDFISHHMLFSKKVLGELKNYLGTLYQTAWDDALIEHIKADRERHFSEYELYMNYFTLFAKKEFKFLSNANITVHRDMLPHIKPIITAYAADYRSIAMHHFILRFQ